MSITPRTVHVATITKKHNGKTYGTHLLRHTYRENGKVRHLTLGDLSDLPADLIEFMRRRLAGEPLPADFQIVRRLPHGPVAAAFGSLKKIGLDQRISSKPDEGWPQPGWKTGGTADRSWLALRPRWLSGVHSSFLREHG